MHLLAVVWTKKAASENEKVVDGLPKGTVHDDTTKATEVDEATGREGPKSKAPSKEMRLAWPVSFVQSTARNYSYFFF